jgi:hypothetical protein
MSPAEIIHEMRYGVGTSEWTRRLAEDLEAAMKSPVAEVVKTPYGAGFTFYWLDPPIGTRLYTIAPDAAAEIERLTKHIDYWRDKARADQEAYLDQDEEIKSLRLQHEEYRKVMMSENDILNQQRDGLRTAAREILARMDSSPERILLAAAIWASEDK